MRTLEQFGTQLDDVQRRAETRIVLSLDTTPGNASCTYLITRPGSYLLGDTVSVRSQRNGIVIASSDVTLDLNGYSIEGGTGSFMGIFIDTAAFSLASANRFGPIVTTALPSGEITATSPWANFAN